MRYLSKHIKHKNLWVAIHLEKIDADLWNLAAIIHKSRRVTCDWYWNRNKKSVRKAKNNKGSASLSHMRLLYKSAAELLNQLPTTANIYTEPAHYKAAVLSRYVERLGFIPIQSDGKSYWVLTAQKRTGEQSDS